MTLDDMLDTYSEDVRTLVLKEVYEEIDYAKESVPSLIAEQFGYVGMKNANLRPLKYLVEAVALDAAKRVVSILGLEQARQATQASDNMFRGTIAGIALAKEGESARGLAEALIGAGEETLS